MQLINGGTDWQFSWINFQKLTSNNQLISNNFGRY